jgi:hypothetical protein
MDGLNLDVDQFIAWLGQREHEAVGTPGTCFLCPVALWLSETVGHVCGVEDGRYGRAIYDSRSWCRLPRWAQVFVSVAERSAFRMLTGAEAFALLLEVERICGGRW